MTSEDELRAKLRKIEALFAGAHTPGERMAAQAARERIQARLKDMEGQEAPIEMRYTLRDGWTARLFLALCRRYGLKPYRRHGQRHTTVMLRVAASFSDQILWPEFCQLADALTAYLEEATARIIREEVFRDATDPEERGA